MLKAIDNPASPSARVSSIIIYALRCWQAVAFHTPTQEKRKRLQKAGQMLLAAHRRNVAHLPLYAATVFVAIKCGNHTTANELLDTVMGYRSFLKTHKPLFYGIFCFLYAYLELKQGRTRSAHKHSQALTEHIKNAPPSPHYSTMLGLLHLEAKEFPEAYKFLSENFHTSLFVAEGLYRYYRDATTAVSGLNILPVLIYAAQRGADIAPAALKFSDTLSAAVFADRAAGEQLYAVSGYPLILKDICTLRIRLNDMSAEAFVYYKDAEAKQIYTPELFAALIRAAYENNSVKINHYPLKKFLATLPADGFGISDSMDDGFAVFVHHFLLTDPDLEDLLPAAQDKILQLGTHCLQENIQSREANTIYSYMWSHFRELRMQGIYSADLDKIEAILQENITRFEVRLQKNSAAKYMYITEPEKRGMDVYEISREISALDENVDFATVYSKVGSTDACLIIEATGENVGYTCLSEGLRAVLNEEITMRPMVGLAGHELYRHFFNNGDRRFHLLTFLANYYLRQDEPANAAIPVFEALLETETITTAYRMRILVAVGRLYYNAFHYEKAMACYARVDDNAIDDDFVEQLLNVYLQTREYTRAARLISSRGDTISNETMFEVVKMLLIINEEKELIAEIGHTLLMKGYFAENLLEFVLAYHDAAYAEWVALAAVIDEDNHTAPKLDERVLSYALAMGCFDSHAQKAFYRLYSVDAANPLIAEFTELATFEMLRNNTRPSYDTVNLLEKIYLAETSVGTGAQVDAQASIGAQVDAEARTLLAWGLADIYIRYGITTFNSEKITQSAAAALESEGIFFPIFREGKFKSTPFMEKFQPFLHKSLSNKDCRLYYQIDGKDFIAVQMQYVRYGIYVAAVPMFFGETFSYYFSEETSAGNVTTPIATVTNEKAFLHECAVDTYYAINSAMIYENMFKHEQVERLISRLVKEPLAVRAKLL